MPPENWIFFQIAVSPRRFIAKMHFLYTQNSMSEPAHGLFLIHRRKVELGKTLGRLKFESLRNKQLNRFYNKFRLRLPILKIPWIFRLKCCFVEVKDSCKRIFQAQELALAVCYWTMYLIFWHDHLSNFLSWDMPSKLEIFLKSLSKHHHNRSQLNQFLFLLVLLWNR